MNDFKYKIIVSSLICTLYFILIAVLHYLYLKKTDNIIYFTNNPSLWAWRTKFNKNTLISMSISALSILVGLYVFNIYIKNLIKK